MMSILYFFQTSTFNFILILIYYFSYYINILFLSNANILFLSNYINILFSCFIIDWWNKLLTDRVAFKISHESLSVCKNTVS